MTLGETEAWTLKELVQSFLAGSEPCTRSKSVPLLLGNTGQPGPELGRTNQKPLPWAAWSTSSLKETWLAVALTRIELEANSLGLPEDASPCTRPSGDQSQLSRWPTRWARQRRWPTSPKKHRLQPGSHKPLPGPTPRTRPHQEGPLWTDGKLKPESGREKRGPPAGPAHTQHLIKPHNDPQQIGLIRSISPMGKLTLSKLYRRDSNPGRSGSKARD